MITDSSFFAWDCETEMVQIVGAPTEEESIISSVKFSQRVHEVFKIANIDIKTG